MSKKNQLASKLSTFSTELKSITPIKVQQPETSEHQQLNDEENHLKPEPKTENKKTNKFKTGELVQTTILLPKELRKVLKKFAFDNDMKVNTVIVDAIEKHILEK